MKCTAVLVDDACALPRERIASTVRRPHPPRLGGRYSPRDLAAAVLSSLSLTLTLTLTSSSPWSHRLDSCCLSRDDPALGHGCNTGQVTKATQQSSVDWIHVRHVLACYICRGEHRHDERYGTKQAELDASRRRLWSRIFVCGNGVGTCAPVCRRL